MPCFGSNKWEIEVPNADVYDVHVSAWGSDDEGVIINVEGEDVSAVNVGGTSYVISTSVLVADGRLTLSSPSATAGFCAVNVSVTHGTVVTIHVNPLAPSQFGEDDANGFVVDKHTVVNAFAKMTGHDASRFVVTSITPSVEDKHLLTVEVLVKDLSTDEDLSVSETLAEFAVLSGDSFWKRSGLQIERMEVGHSKPAIPAWSIATIAVVCVIVAVGVAVIVVVLYRRHRKQQSPQAEAQFMMSSQAQA